MEDYVIDVSEIEELQIISNVAALDIIFYKARKIVISGGIVVLERKNRDGSSDRFDSFTTEEEIDDYKNRVYK